MLVRVALREDDIDRVADLAARARARGGGQPRLIRMAIHMQAVAARMRGDYTSARRLYQESIEVNESLQEERMVAAECRNLAYVELHDGRLERARSLFAEAGDRSRRVGYQTLVPYLIGDAAVLALEDGMPPGQRGWPGRRRLRSRRRGRCLTPMMLASRHGCARA